MKAKICGLPSVEVAKQVIDLGPDAIGIYCWTDPEKGRNFTTFEIAKQIAALAAQKDIDTFYLTYALTAKDVYRECSAIGNTHVQLLGDIPLSELATVKQMLPSLQTVKVIGVTGEESVDEALTYDSSDAVDQLLLDSRSGNARGGTGKTHDWNISGHIAESATKPVWLAGGIRLYNVEEAMRTVGPDGIDVETGVQQPDGTKDYAAIQEFLSLVHNFQK